MNLVIFDFRFARLASRKIMGSFKVYMYMHTRWDHEPTCALGAPASLPAIRKTIQVADESPPSF
jgi:hypothetical protein